MVTKKKTKKASAAKATKVVEPRDPRESVPIGPAAMKAALASIRAVVETIEKPAEPAVGELMDAALHRVFADKLPCGVAQEILHRIEVYYVDRNEYRVTEAFEVEEMLADLELPDTFERCRVAKQVIGQVFNDQNKSSLAFMREAAMAERKGFFQRVPGISPMLTAYLNRAVDLEEVLFSPRSTQRVQQRLYHDPKQAATEEFFAAVRELVAPFGYLPLLVAPPAKRAGGKPQLEPELCPMCSLIRVGAK